MCVYNIKEITDKVKIIADNYPISRICLFGSYARGEAVEESDVDLIVDAEQLKGLKFFGFYEELKNAFDKKIDLLTESQINSNRNDTRYKKLIEELETDRKVIYGS